MTSVFLVGLIIGYQKLINVVSSGVNLIVESFMDDQLTKKEKDKDAIATGRGKETLFRVSARNQIELIAIADNKANIIIGINAILISVIIALFGSDYTFGTESVMENDAILYPFSILLVFSLVSCSLAIFAAKPVIIRDLKGQKKTRSVLFFDLSSQITLEEYMADMRQLLSSKKDTYDQMMIEMYSNGQVLKRKYSFLRVAYLLFMIGFILSVLVAFGMTFLSA